MLVIFFIFFIVWLNNLFLHYNSNIIRIYGAIIRNWRLRLVHLPNYVTVWSFLCYMYVYTVPKTCKDLHYILCKCMHCPKNHLNIHIKIDPVRDGVDVSDNYAGYSRRFISFLGQCGTGSTECVKYLCQIYP